jgi:hypothetical protein
MWDSNSLSRRVTILRSMHNQIHLPSGIDADAHRRDGFADDAATYGEVALTDCNEQNHPFTKPDKLWTIFVPTVITLVGSSLRSLRLFIFWL